MDIEKTIRNYTKICQSMCSSSDIRICQMGSCCHDEVIDKRRIREDKAR